MLLVRPAPQALAPFVDVLFYASQFGDYARGLGLPKPAPELVINLGDPYALYNRSHGLEVARYRTGWLTGVSGRVLPLKALGQSSMIGVRFKPFGARAFFDFPLSLVVGRPLPLYDVWGTQVESLRDQILSQASHDMQFEVLGEFLCRKLDPRVRVHPAVGDLVEKLERTSGRAPLATLTRDTSISAGHARALFRDTVGVSPKLLGRLFRFSHTLTVLNETARGSLTRVAHSLGFHDQSHFIRDFADLATMPPSRYIELRGAGKRRNPPVHFVELSEMANGVSEANVV